MTEFAAITVQGDIQAEDSLRAGRYKYRRLFMAYRLVGVTFLILGILSNMYWDELDPVLPVLGTFVALMPSLQLLRYKRVLTKTPSLYGHHVLTFGDDGFRAKNPQMESHQPWTFFTAFMESDDDMILRSGKTYFQAIPKRLFQTEDQMVRVRGLLTERISPAHAVES